jgi:hypothetical protein
MRVLLWDLPQWLNDILREAIRGEEQFELVESPARGTDVLTRLAQTEVDVLVIHGSGNGVADRSSEILFAHPRLRLVSLGAGGGGTAELALIPARALYGDVSLNALVHIIAGDQTTQTIALAGSTEPGV